MLFIISKKKFLLFVPLFAFLLLCLLVSHGWAAHPKMEEWKASRQVIDHFDTTEKAIALTFDDGPNPKATANILKTLCRFQAHATFFVVGENLKQYPDLGRQIIDAGHELGNHSLNHADFNTLSSAAMKANLQQSNEIIRNVSSRPCLWLRPPGGYLSVDLVENIVPALSMKIGYWSYVQDSKDWKPGQSAEAIAASILKNIAPGQIILLHDGCQNSPETAKALEIFLPELIKQGYRFLTLSEMEECVAIK